MEPVFVTGGTGYIGRPLIDALIDRHVQVHALVRRGSESKLPPGAWRALGDALDADTFAESIPQGATIVHLIGTPHPRPSKAAEFRRVDLASIQATVDAAVRARAGHIIYMSVAHPAPVMRAYIAVRSEGESLIAESGIPATVLRPWYVLGPGHRWPYLLVPAYAVLAQLPATRQGAQRLGLVTLEQVLATLVSAVEHPPSSGVRIVDVPQIRRGSVESPG